MIFFRRAYRLLQGIDRKADIIMATQADIDAAVQAFQGFFADVTAQVTQLGADVNSIQAKITELEAANPAADTTALNDLVAGLAGTQQALDQAVASATAVAPPPAS